MQYLRLPTEAEATRAGFELADFADDAQAEVWPENDAAWSLWSDIHSQWRTGPSGAYALDYGVVFTRLQMLAVDADTREELFAAVRVMERAALDQMAENEGRGTGAAAAAEPDDTDADA